MRNGPPPRRIVLASASPRRRELLEAAGFEVLCRPADVEELSGGHSPRELVAANAEMKAEKAKVFKLKVSPKRGLSVYLGGRFPTTLYKDQWKHVLDHADEIRTFIEANDAELASK